MSRLRAGAPGRPDGAASRRGGTAARLAGLIGIVLAAAPAASVQPRVPEGLDLSRVRAIAVQHNGRWMPLDTLARDVVSEVTGAEFFRGRDPVAMLLAWTIDPQRWQDEPLIPVKNAEVRRVIGLPVERSTFSYSELLRHPRLRQLIESLDAMESGRKLDPLQSRVSGIHEKLVLLQNVFLGRAVKPIPDPGDALAAWRSTAWLKRAGRATVPEASRAWAELEKAFLAARAPAFAVAADRLVAVLGTLPAAHRPAPAVLATELRYNRLRPFRAAWIIMALGTLLSLGAVLVRRRWFDVLAVAAMIAGFAVLTYGLSLRWTLAGRIPAANMFESLLFLSWGMGAFAIVALLFVRHRSVPLTASFMGALSLCLADSLPLDHFVRPVPPVLLDTVWMSIHVPIIMVSYSVLFLGVLIAHAQVFVAAAAPGRLKTIESIDRFHYWYIHAGSILLFIGIVTGSMWAASSWGRYWGWDPKEVWSLVAFLGYMAIMHVRVSREVVPRWAYAVAAGLGVIVFASILPKMAPLTATTIAWYGAIAAAGVFFLTAQSRTAVAVKSILAFWLIIMTYVGVNYVLGIGLHSYGFGKGAVASRVYLIGGIDLVVVLACFLVHLARQRPGALAPAGVPAAS